MTCCEHPASNSYLQSSKETAALLLLLPYIEAPPFPSLLAHSSATASFRSNTSTTVKLDSFTFSELEPQTRHSPIIVGDHYELAETVALQYLGDNQGDLLAKAEYPAALLPMSNYEEPGDAKVHHQYNARRPSQAYSSLTEYNARRPSQDPMYLQHALPGANDPQLQQHSTAYDRQNDHMSYGASSLYQPRASFEATPSACNDFELRNTLDVSSPNPQRGTKGTLIYISLNSSRDLLSPSPLIASLMFASRSVPAGLARLEAQEQSVSYNYLVSAIAPAFSETGCSNLRIPLRLQLQGQSLIDVGEWLYEDGKQLEYRSFPQVPRKRRNTDEPPDSPRSTKRLTPPDQQPTPSQDYGSYPYSSASLALPQSLHNIDLNTMQRKYTAYGRSQLQQGLQQESNTMGSQGLIGGASNSQSVMRPPTGQTSPWNSSYGAGYQSGRNPRPNAALSFQASTISSPIRTNPRLVRTTNLAKQSRGSSSDANFNSNTRYPDPAVLEIRGNLNAMQENWTPEERAVKRRIVRFWREQNGTTLTAYFKPVRADEQPLPHETNERRINCLYCEERNKFYVTSVDAIHLLQSLLAEEFPIDEKNRIRRNLETYHPCTIKKDEPESESLFKLIMGCPSPKPWIIQKSVKVFEWPILEQALKKIISKYSADTSSIAGPLRSQPSSNFSGPQAEAGAGRYSDLSSRSTSGSTASYAQTLESSTLSPLPASHGLPSYSQASPLQQFATPGISHSYTVPTLGSQYSSNDTSISPYAAPISMPGLSSPYTASNIGRHRSSDVPTDDTFASSSHYSRRPRTSTIFASPYAPDNKATLGLPGHASLDYAAYLDTDAASAGSLVDAQYRRHSGVNDETDTMQFKDE